MQATELDDKLNNTREVSENALAAANAYNNIVSAIEEARLAAVAAEESGQKVRLICCFNV